MDNEKYKLERKLIIADIKLEKEKLKRDIIMVLLCSILCGFVFSLLIDENILSLIVMSIIFGCILYFIVMFAFAFASDSLTNTNCLESYKRHIEEELKNNFQDKNTSSNFNIDKIKKYAKGKLTDKDYETILRCIEFSINSHKFEIENDDNELTVTEKSTKLKELKWFYDVLDVFTTRSKPSPFEKTTALNCVYTYFDTMIDISDFNENISDEHKNELYQKITDLNSVIFKLELQ